MRGKAAVKDRLSDNDKAGVRRLYTVQQAADVAEVSVEEICYWVRMGKLKAYRLGGGRVRIDETDLLASIEPRELEW